MVRDNELASRKKREGGHGDISVSVGLPVSLRKLVSGTSYMLHLNCFNGKNAPLKNKKLYCVCKFWTIGKFLALMFFFIAQDGLPSNFYVLFKSMLLTPPAGTGIFAFFFFFVMPKQRTRSNSENILLNYQIQCL